jgi:hypothetical protein
VLHFLEMLINGPGRQDHDRGRYFQIMIGIAMTSVKCFKSELSSLTKQEPKSRFHFRVIVTMETGDLSLCREERREKREEEN